LIVQLAEGMLDQSGQLIGSTVNGLVQGSCSVSDRDGLAAFEASFHHAALVVVAAFTGIFVAQVHLHSRDVIAESAEGILYDGTHLSGQRFMTFDIMVGIDLDLHVALLIVGFPARLQFKETEGRAEPAGAAQIAARRFTGRPCSGLNTAQ